MKKILLLGGSTQQIPAIKYANSKGYYTVLCDYLSDNPGQRYANKYYCVSTTDKEAILSVAKKEYVDGVVAYASDPAAPTAAYVAEQLGLPANPYESVEKLSYKDKFRKFLVDNGFNCPKAKSYTSIETAEHDIEKFTYPIMVKPVDSSGSKGISMVDKTEDFKIAFSKALECSRCKRVIIEEYISKDHPFMIGGDCFIINGKIKYWGLLNSYRNENINPFVPVGTSYPIIISEKRLDKVKNESQRLFDLLGIKFGAFNIEIMFDKSDNLYFIEMGARNGGNMIPDLLLMATNENLVAATIDSAMGEEYIFKHNSFVPNFLSTYVLHSAKDGCFLGVKYKNGIEKKIIQKILYKKKGDSIQYFDGANKAIGILFHKFETQDEQLDFMFNPEKWIEVLVE